MRQTIKPRPLCCPDKAGTAPSMHDEQKSSVVVSHRIVAMQQAGIPLSFLTMVHLVHFLNSENYPYLNSVLLD